MNLLHIELHPAALAREGTVFGRSLCAEAKRAHGLVGHKTHSKMRAPTSVIPHAAEEAIAQRRGRLCQRTPRHMNFDPIDRSEELLWRTYHLADGREVELVVGRPARSSEGEDFECRYEIRGFGDGSMRYAGGVDGLQCVLLALEAAAAFLIASPEYQLQRLYWLDPDDADLGLPLSPYGDGSGWR